MKTCTGCGVEKSLDLFHRERGRPDGFKSRCIQCYKEARDARLLDPAYREKLRLYGAAFRRNDRDRKYGVVPGTVDRLMSEQSGLCAVCGTKPEGRDLNVDHDHVTGRIRGLLCLNCNLALGHVSDSIERLLSLASYLIASENLLEMT